MIYIRSQRKDAKDPLLGIDCYDPKSNYPLLGAWSALPKPHILFEVPEVVREAHAAIHGVLSSQEFRPLESSRGRQIKCKDLTEKSMGQKIDQGCETAAEIEQAQQRAQKALAAAKAREEATEKEREEAEMKRRQANREAAIARTIAAVRGQQLKATKDKPAPKRAAAKTDDEKQVNKRGRAAAQRGSRRQSKLVVSDSDITFSSALGDDDGYQFSPSLSPIQKEVNKENAGRFGNVDASDRNAADLQLTKDTIEDMLQKARAETDAMRQQAKYDIEEMKRQVREDSSRTTTTAHPTVQSVEQLLQTALEKQALKAAAPASAPAPVPL